MQMFLFFTFIYFQQFHKKMPGGMDALALLHFAKI